MKKIIVLAACFFTLATTVTAQENSAKPVKSEGRKGQQKLTLEQRAQKIVDKMNAEVTLTEDQKTKIQGFATEKLAKVDEVRAKYKGQPDKKELVKKEVAAERNNFRDQTKAILTAEQNAKLKAKHKEMKAAGKANSLELND